MNLTAEFDAEETLEALLVEGLESGEATAMTPTGWKGLRDEVRARLESPAADA